MTTETPPSSEAEKEKEPELAAELSWKELGLSDKTLTLIEQAGFVKPTLIQQQCIPIALRGQDLIASARTGSGKTAAFGLPVIEKLLNRRGTLSLVLCPTREIALQTFETFKIFGEPLGVRSAVLIGGVNMKSDMAALQNYPHILVGTPGRIVDHMERGHLWLEYIEIVVLDEADRILDMGFSAQVDRIMDATPETRQTMLFSATMPPMVHKLAKTILREPEKIAIGDPLAASASVDQLLLWVNEDSKKREIMRLITEEKGTIIIFTQSKDGATHLWRWLHAAGIHDSTYISSSKKQEHREEALQGFKNGKYRILIATDVAGRGIHVEGVSLVVNFDFPDEAEDYIHRIGRTGRKEHMGRAISFVTPRDASSLIQVEKTVKRMIPEQRAPDYRVDIRPPRSGKDQGHGRSRGRNRGRGSGRGGRRR